MKLNILADKTKLNKLVHTWASEAEAQVNSWPEYSGFNLSTIKLDWSTRRTCSRGGWYDGPGINMAMAMLFRERGKPYRLYEYKSYDLDKVIGGFYAEDQMLAAQVIVIHEVAHAAQFYADRSLGLLIDRPHGESFKKPYRRLRTELFNFKIPVNQSQLAKRYNDTISEITKGRINWTQLDC
jgi:hypothetical protein